MTLLVDQSRFIFMCLRDLVFEEVGRTYRDFRGLEGKHRYMAGAQLGANRILHPIHEVLVERYSWFHEQKENNTLICIAWSPLADTNRIANL